MSKSMTRKQAVVFADPKPARGAHWNKSLRAARLYTDQCCRDWARSIYPRCVTCGSTFNLEWAHVLSGKGDAVRWEEKNMTRQCNPCNQLHEFRPGPLIDWFVKTYGYPAFVTLTTLGNTTVKRTYSQIMAIGDRYKKGA